MQSYQDSDRRYHSFDDNRHEDEEIQEYGYPSHQSRRRDNIVGATGFMAAAIALMIVDMSIHGILISGLLIAAGIVVALPKKANAVLCNLEKWQRKYNVNLLTILCPFVSVVFILDLASAPANAQFFQPAQTWMEGAFAGIDADVVALFFNVLRAIFLLYLGISIVKVIDGARNNEDWQNLARTPFIIVVAVVAADIITTMIVGGAT